jgi:hypothetical protein
MAVNINIPSQVSQTITDGVTDKAPSENAVNDALALKANTADLGATAFSNDYNDLDNLPTLPSGTVTSVGLTMPSAFNVADSPVTGAGTLAVTGAGLTSQYVRGDGSLGNFPSNGGGGSSVNYFLNGSVSQGTFGGSTYYELSKTPVIGAGTNFTRTNAQGNGYIASFITDAGDPNLLNIPGGNWNLEFYFNSSSNGGSPSFYAELYKVDLSNAFTLIASGATNPEGITNGTTVDQYFTSIPVPQTTILATDRIAIRIFVTPGGRNITLHTEDNNLSQIITTFSTGLNALNGLSAQVQYFGVGTSGTDFNIDSVTDTHTFNLPTASATNRGALSTSDWSAFNGKQAALVSGTNIKTINGNSLLGSGDIVVGAASGIFGISNISGVYTYYATLTLAIAAATAGQTIEMFANVTETGAVTITLKNGVNINGNGYTYTLSNSGTSNAFIDNGIAVTCEIYNLKVIRTLGATPSNTANLCLSLTNSSSEIKCNGVFLRNTNGTCVLNQSNLWNISALSTNGTLGTVFNTGNLYNSYFESTNSLAIYSFSGNVINCTGIANTSGIGIYSQTASTNIYNSYGKSLSGNGISGTGKFYKTIAISTSGNAIEATASSEFHQCIGISTSGLGISGNSHFAYQCRFISSSNYAAGAGANAEHYDCSHESTSNISVFGYIGLKLYRGSAYSKWNNAGGHAFSQWSSGSGSVLNNVFLRVTNASSNCINAGGVTTFNYSQNAFLGATTSVSANITQGLSNLEDLQGNQKL